MELPIIEEQIRVFVSSAMSKESIKETGDDFKWLDFRKSVKKELKKCKYINAFTIEDHASEMKSNDFMIYNVNKADIVVLLVRNEFRKGTSVEYTHCRKTNKPLLVYFFGNEKAGEEVKDLRDQLINDDYCTFREMNDFKNAEKKISNDVIQNVIIYYQQKHYSSQSLNSIEIDGVPVEKTLVNDTYIPTKTVLSLFKSCYGTIYKRLGISEYYMDNSIKDYSKLHETGEQIINWLINGKLFLTNNVKKELIDAVSVIYPNTEWYSKRLDSIDFYLQGDLIRSFESEQESLKLAEKANIVPWIVNNILIDLRNLQFEIPTINGIDREEYKKRLDEIKYTIYVPVLDRYLENTYEKLIAEEIKIHTATTGTTFFGNCVNELLTEIESYLFLSILFGSYTHLTLTRKILANVLYKMGKLYNDSSILYAAVKMFLMAGQYKDFNRICTREWNEISNEMITHSDALWQQVINIQEINKELSCINALSQIGLYLNDKNFSEAEDYLLGISSKLSWKNSESYISCLQILCGRMNQDIVVKSIVRIIETHNYATANKLTQLLSNIDYDYVTKATLNNLCEALKNNLSQMISRNGNPQFIAVLVKHKPDIFTVLETIPNNGLTGDQKLLYDLILNKGDWQKILLFQIEIAQKQLERNNKINALIEFGSNPYLLISMAFEENPSAEIINTINEKFFTLCIRLLKSECPIQTKDQCAECLCTVLGYYKKNGLEISKDLINCVEEISLNNTPNIFDTFRTSESLLCRLITLKIIVGVLDKSVLIQWCITYAKKEPSERYALVQCLRSFLQYSVDLNGDVDAIIVSIILQCCDDQEVYIRTVACECLWFILDSQYKKQAEDMLYEMTIDPSPQVKNKLLNICKSKPNHIKLIKKIVYTLIDDANYIINTKARKLLKNNLEVTTE